MFDEFLQIQRTELSHTYTADDLVSLDGDILALSSEMNTLFKNASDLVDMAKLSSVIKTHGVHPSLLAFVDSERVLSANIANFPSVESLLVGAEAIDVVATSESIMEFVKNKAEAVFNKISEVGTSFLTKVGLRAKVESDKIADKASELKEMDLDDTSGSVKNGISAKSAGITIAAILGMLVIVRRLGAVELSEKTASKYVSMLNPYKMGIARQKRLAEEALELKAAGLPAKTVKELGWFRTSLSGVFEQLKKVYSEIRDAIVGVWTFIKNIPEMFKFTGALHKAMGGGIGNAFKLTGAYIHGFIMTVWLIFKNVILNAIRLTKTLFVKIWRTVTGLFKKSKSAEPAA